MGDDPVVFVSHASEDKERFVLDLARRLMARGINAWLDRWEMYPGDSLVDKIFEEGLKDAKAVIVVVSDNSIGKPWVKEELNAAVVKRIQTGCRLIPVVLDGCEVPEALRSTVWEPIADTEDYGLSFERIVASILGDRDKPALGPLPAYVQNMDEGIFGLTKVDFLVLREFVRIVLLKGDLQILRTELVWPVINGLGISREGFLDACTVLCDRFMLKPSKVIAPEPPYYSLTEHGLDIYLSGREPEFWEQFERAKFLVVNGSVSDNDKLAESISVDRLRARLILLMMQRRQYVRLTGAAGGLVRILEVRPALRRALR